MGYLAVNNRTAEFPFWTLLCKKLQAFLVSSSALKQGNNTNSIGNVTCLKSIEVPGNGKE